MALITATFETRAANANDGKIVVVFTDEDGISGSAWVGKVAVTSPTGVVLRTYTTSQVTFGPGGTGTILVPIPLDASGAYLRGNYAFSLYLDNTAGNPNPDKEAVVAYNYCPHNSPNHTTSDLIKMLSSVNCDTKLMTITDTTDYTVPAGLTMITRVITFSPPSIANISPTTTTGASMVGVLTYTNVTYGSELNVSFQYNEQTPTAGVTLVSMGSAEIFIERLVDCGQDMCALTKCLAARFDTLNEQAVNVGGWANLGRQTLGNFQYARDLISIAVMLKSCNEYTMAKGYFDRAKVLLNCNCGCPDTTQPVPL